MCLVQDSQKNIEIINDIEVPNKSEEETEIQSIDECKTVDLQDELDWWEPVEMPDIPIRVTEEQEIEENIKEEVVSDMTLPEMCNAEVRMHKNELKLELPIIKDTCRMHNESKLFQNMMLNCDIPLPIHEITQSMTEQ